MDLDCSYLEQFESHTAWRSTGRFGRNVGESVSGCENVWWTACQKQKSLVPKNHFSFFVVKRLGSLVTSGSLRIDCADPSCASEIVFVKRKVNKGFQALRAPQKC